MLTDLCMYVIQLAKLELSEIKQLLAGHRTTPNLPGTTTASTLRQQIGVLCERAGLILLALQHFESQTDLRRVILNGKGADLPKLVQCFGSLPSDWALEIMKVGFPPCLYSGVVCWQFWWCTHGYCGRVNFPRVHDFSGLKVCLQEFVFLDMLFYFQCLLFSADRGTGSVESWVIDP